jgi:hypothetical protein
MISDVVDDLTPRLAPKQLLGGDGLVHQRSPLLVDLARADRVVTHLRVAHVVVARHPDGDSMRSQGGVGIDREQPVEDRRPRVEDRIPFPSRIHPDSVEYDGHDGAANSAEALVSLQHD